MVIVPLFKSGQLFGLVGVIEVITGLPQSPSLQSMSPSPSSSILLSQISGQIGSASSVGLLLS